MGLVEVTAKPQCLVIAISGNLHEPLGDHLDRSLSTLRLTRDDPRPMVVDLTYLAYINQTGLVALVKLHTDRARQERPLVFVRSVNSNIQNILLISKLAFVFTIYPTLDAAIAALSTPAPS